MRRENRFFDDVRLRIGGSLAAPTTPVLAVLSSCDVNDACEAAVGDFSDRNGFGMERRLVVRDDCCCCRGGRLLMEDAAEGLLRIKSVR